MIIIIFTMYKDYSMAPKSLEYKQCNNSLSWYGACHTDHEYVPLGPLLMVLLVVIMI